MRIKVLIIIGAICLVFSGCQPTPEVNIVVNKNDGVLEEKINQEVSGAPSFIVPENIKEEVYLKEGKYSVAINAGVEKMTLDAYPVYLITPDDFTQSEVDAVIKYFFKDSPLYAQDYTRSKSMIADMIVQIRADLQKMAPDDTDDIESANEAIKRLEREYNSAPETVTRTQITSKLTVPSGADFDTLDACVDLGNSELSSINVANLENYQFTIVILDKNRYYLSSALLTGKSPEGQKMTQDEAKQKAEDALVAMGIKNMTVIKIETGMTQDQSKQGYVVTLRQSVNGVPVAQNRGLNYTSDDMAVKWQSDSIKIGLDDKGISYFSWNNKGKIENELTPNIEMKTFDEIIGIARQQLKNKFAWIETSNLNYYQSIHIDRIVLEYTCAQKKDSPSQYLLVPTWNFYGDIDNTYENGITEPQHGVKSTDTCILSLNAVDGSVVGSSN